MMAKTDDRASQYVFVEDEDIFAEDEQRLLSRKKEIGGMYQAPGASSSRSHPTSVISKSNPLASRFRQDPLVVQRDAAKFHRAVKLLSSIPPPPAATNPQFTLHNIIDLWNRNNCTSELKNNWQPGLDEERLGHDVYLNRNNYVEELEHLRQTLTERFVSNETASHLTFTCNLASEHKRELQRRNGMLKSSAAHLNHLSQRKSFFNQFSNPNVRTFVYDNNKRLNYTKSQPDAKAQSQMNSKGHSNYRALFHSPKKQVATSQMFVPGNYSHTHNPVSTSYYSGMPASNYSIPSTASTASSSSSSSLVTPTRCALPGYASSRSEKLVSSVSQSGDLGGRKSCTKNLQFDEPSYSDKSVKKPKKLSQLHGKKMLWAVETLLKSEGVVNTDPEYKVLYTHIYRETTQVWLKYCEKRENGKYKDSATGTSDLMVSVAKKLLPSVEQKLGILCNVIKARKEAAKKTLEISSNLKTENPYQTPSANLPCRNTYISEAPSKTKQLNVGSSSLMEEIVFSPEMLSVSNLCDGIDAVISSLDDLAPDPGDRSAAVQAKPSNTLSVIVAPNSSKRESASTCLNSEIKVLLSAPLINSAIPLLPISLTADPEGSFIEKSKSDNPIDQSIKQLSACPVEGNVSSQPNHLANPVDLTLPQMTLMTESKIDDNTVSIDALDLTAEIITSLNSLPTISEIFGDDNTELLPQLAVEPVTDISLENPLDLKKIPDCVVKLERCQYTAPAPNENIKTPECLPIASEESKSFADLTPSTSIVNLNNSSSKKTTFNDKMNDDESPEKSSAKSDRRRSKRKRNSDISSNENTPSSSAAKSRTSKKLCSDQITDTNEIQTGIDQIANRLRRSSRNKLPFDVDKEENPIIEDKISPLKGKDSLNLQNELETDNDAAGENQICRIVPEASGSSLNHHDEDSIVHKPIGDNVSTIQEGESSTSGNKDASPKNIDKENDSSMENISDVDNQNWSPILKLKRSSKDLWSSELKKKRISRRRKDNSENSPISSPFLDLEGPFKYRFCKRARPGEFVSAVIRGEMYSKAYRKLVKRKDVTKDCVLVRTVKEGLELRIPFELLQKERIFFGPNGFQNMISDIVEDAICKLEGFDSETTFSGFTLHDVNQAVMTSSVMERTLKVIEQTGEVVKPLFTMYKYALVKQSPQNFQDFYQIFVEILRTSLFLRKTMVESDTIQVRPLKTESPKKIQLEINIPVKLIGNNNRFKENILKDLTPVHNIISC